MVRPFLVFAAFALVAAAPAPAPALKLAGEIAAIENSDGEPQFVIRDLAYLADTYGGPIDTDAYDRATRRFRVTPAGQPSLWIRCADLDPAPAACRPAATGAVRDEEDVAAPLSRNLPDCPGDPRCPRRGSK